MIYSLSQPIKHSDLIFELSKESAAIYNQALTLHQNNHKDFSEISLIIDREFAHNCLHSQSKQASYQKYFNDFKAFSKALKEFKKSPDKFSGEPKPPHKQKFLKPIYFKQSAIRYDDNKLYLSTKRPNPPIVIRWNDTLPIPKFAIIAFDYLTGWNINFVVETKEELNNTSSEKIMSIDLGVKRTATTFDGSKVVTYSGKELLFLNNYRNKLLAKTQEKYSKTGKESRKRKYLKRAYRKKVKYIKYKEKDILHKMSKTIINNAIKNDIGKIVIGDCLTIHKNTNLGKLNNQKINQNLEQKLRCYIKYKFSDIGRSTEVVSERYSTRKCPICGEHHKPTNRTYKCTKCGYKYDRDGVGAINIYGDNTKKESFGEKFLDVIGGLTPPLGWKYHPNLSCCYLR